MASRSLSRRENSPGSLFVDQSCINCGTCRLIAKDIFADVNGKSAVLHQPMTQEQWVVSNQALISCPTNSIGTVDKRLSELRAAVESFPILIEDGVYYCGYASQSSYGASSYLIVRDGGNVLVDSPRFNAQLAKQIGKLGGIRYLFLTHKDDVADHTAFQKYFGCERIIHSDDVTVDTEAVETKIHGELDHSIANDLLAIPTPGHTKGHVVLLYKDKFLFTGDHLAYSQEERSLYAFDDACWYSWDRQIESILLLKKYSFEWILPGHGSRGRIEDSAKLIDDCVRKIRSLR